MYWLRWHYHVKDIAGAPYKIKENKTNERIVCLTVIIVVWKWHCHYILLFGWQLYCTCRVEMSQLAGGNWSLLLRPSDAGDMQSVRHRCHHADDDYVQRQMDKNCERVVYTR